MQFLRIKEDTKLTDLAQQVGARNVESVLHLNSLTRSPNIGRQLRELCNQRAAEGAGVSRMAKLSLLNTMTSDSDIFETAALQNTQSWKTLASLNTFPGYVRIPESIRIPDSTSTIGNRQPVPSRIYEAVIDDVVNRDVIRPEIFNEYSSASVARVSESLGKNPEGNPMQWFRVPWGQVTLHSSISDEMIDFPVYPEEVGDAVRANYQTMPDLLYQYEQWQLYVSSGPRTNVYSFHFHRDMWTGDHRDGKANDLIRACESNVYADYRGSAVHTSTVTLYVAGHALISGILTDVSVKWAGPLGLDGWYLECMLELTITEVAKAPKSYTSVRRMPLIG